VTGAIPEGLRFPKLHSRHLDQRQGQQPQSGHNTKISELQSQRLISSTKRQGMLDAMIEHVKIHFKMFKRP